MRMKGFLLAWTVFIFAGALCAQTPGTQTQSQDTPQGLPKCLSDVTDYQYSVTFTQLTIRNQAALRRQFEDQLKEPAQITEKELASEVRRVPAETVIKDVKTRGVAFDMSPGIEKKLRKANASEEVIEAVREAGPTFRAQMATMILGPGSARVQNVPKEQAREFSRVMGERAPDKAIALAETFTKQFPQSPLLGYVYSLVANAYHQKGDIEKVVAYTGYSLNFNPDNLTSLILRVGALSQPQYLRRHAVNGGKILQEALSEANHALQLISQIPKLPNETEAEYHRRLADYGSEIHGPLGMVHLMLASGGPSSMDKAELAKAEQEFTTAVSTSSHPDPRDYFRLGEAYKMDGKWGDAIQAFTKAGKLGQGTLIQTYATELIAQVKKRNAEDSVASNPHRF